jgi:hypothetical protein
MPLDAHLPHAPALDITAQVATAQPLLPALTRAWNAATPASAEADLGYESALPWVLTELTPAEIRPAA